MLKLKSYVQGTALALLSLIVWQPATAADWSNTELHIQIGNLDVPSFAGGGSSDHVIYTLQHASGWKYGDNFFFFDILDGDRPGFQDFDMYGEWYTNFSLGKIMGKPVGGGFVKDIGIILGFNWAADANVKKYLPGVRLSLDLPGFAFANLDITAYLDDSEGFFDPQGNPSGGAPSEDNSFMIDFNWARPFKIGDSNFSIEGHIEYIGERDNEFGGKVESWILAQPQFRWYVRDNIALGIEYQFWQNKLGDAATDESAVQALFVWKF